MFFLVEQDKAIGIALKAAWHEASFTVHRKHILWNILGVICQVFTTSQLCEIHSKKDKQDVQPETKLTVHRMHTMFCAAHVNSENMYLLS